MTLLIVVLFSGAEHSDGVLVWCLCGDIVYEGSADLLPKSADVGGVKLMLLVVLSLKNGGFGESNAF